MSDQTASNILATNDPTFEADVFGRSTLVILDFWAAWCAPCRMLMPVLEKIAIEQSDWITLIKVNTDECPIAAGSFGIQGIPAVYAVLGDKVVDQFQGALPEVAIRQWLDNLRPQWQLMQLDQGFASDPDAALAQLRSLSDQSPSNASLKIRLAEKLVLLKKFDEANQIIAVLEARGFLEPEATKLKSQLRLMERQPNAESIQACQAEVDQKPSNFEAKLRLAELLAADGQYEKACQVCLELVAQDRKATGEKARELMIDIFRTLPDESEITSKYRRQLAMALY